jgi:hypothetical protein
MAAKTVDHLPSEPSWSFEPTFDGFRALAFQPGRARVVHTVADEQADGAVVAVVLRGRDNPMCAYALLRLLPRFSAAAGVGSWGSALTLEVRGQGRGPRGCISWSMSVRRGGCQ